MRTVLLRPIMRLLFSRVKRMSVLMTKPEGEPVGLVRGDSPDRILIFGDGTAQGWGVARYELAIPGQLAVALAARTGRGAEIDLVANHTIRIASAESLVAEQKLWWYDGVLVLIGIEDAFCLLPPSQWRSGLVALLDRMIAELPPKTPIVVAGLLAMRLLPVFSEQLTRGGQRHGPVLNTITEDVCNQYPDVHYFLPATVTLTGNNRTKFADSYKETAVEVADIFAPLLNDVA